MGKSALNAALVALVVNTRQHAPHCALRPPPAHARASWHAGRRRRNLRRRAVYHPHAARRRQRPPPKRQPCADTTAAPHGWGRRAAGHLRHAAQPAATHGVREYRGRRRRCHHADVCAGDWCAAAPPPPPSAPIAASSLARALRPPNHHAGSRDVVARDDDAVAGATKRCGLHPRLLRINVAPTGSHRVAHWKRWV
jgi:hypothetical protein